MTLDADGDIYSSDDGTAPQRAGRVEQCEHINEWLLRHLKYSCKNISSSINVNFHTNTSMNTYSYWLVCSSSWLVPKSNTIKTQTPLLIYANIIILSTEYQRWWRI